MQYKESGLTPEILRAVTEMGFEEMTPIQEQAIPVLLTGKDVIGQAQTGTGKTAAFGIPLVMGVDPKNRNLQGLVLCPTRELAMQAAEEIRRFAKYMHGIRVLPIYGGQEIYKQIKALKGGVQIIVGTPGRVMDHMRRHTIRMEDVRMVVLDEADEMLNMGFREDMETILKEIQGEHQTALFSATMPKPILDITGTYQKPDAVMVQVVKEELTISLVEQSYYSVRSQYKEEATARLLAYHDVHRALIFCNTKKKVDELAENLKGRGFLAEALHGDMSQHQRDLAMNRFRNGKLEILIATDVAARGIDVDDVEVVINYDIPQDIEFYVHRIGRTGRAGKEGKAFTLISGREIYKIREIERMCKTKLREQNIPSANAITTLKAQNKLQEAEALLSQDADLERLKKLVERVCEDREITAVELAAALLRLQMGEEIEEIADMKEHFHKAERGSSRGRQGQRGERKGSDARKRFAAGKGEKKRLGAGGSERRSSKDEKQKTRNNQKSQKSQMNGKAWEEKKKHKEKKERPGHKDSLIKKTTVKESVRMPGHSGFRRERSSL